MLNSHSCGLPSRVNVGFSSNTTPLPPPPLLLPNYTSWIRPLCCLIRAMQLFLAKRVRPQGAQDCSLMVEGRRRWRRMASEEESCGGKRIFSAFIFFRVMNQQAFCLLLLQLSKQRTAKPCQAMNDTQGHVNFESFVFFLSNNIQKSFPLKDFFTPK